MPDSIVRKGLFGSRCSQCGTLVFPALTICSECLGDELELQELDSHGTLYSYTILHRDDGPIALGYVDSPNGIRIFGRISDPQGLSLDMKVHVSHSSNAAQVCLFTPARN